MTHTEERDKYLETFAENLSNIFFEKSEHHNSMRAEAYAQGNDRVGAHHSSLSVAYWNARTEVLDMLYCYNTGEPESGNEDLVEKTTNKVIGMLGSFLQTRNHLKNEGNKH